MCVKVLRPGVEEIVDTDLDILRTQARFVAQHSEMANRYDVVEIADEFANAVRGELDYLVEAANCERLGSAFADDDTVAFPKVYWEFTTTRVLTTERLVRAAVQPAREAHRGWARPRRAREGRHLLLLRADLRPRLLPRRSASREPLRAR